MANLQVVLTGLYRQTKPWLSVAGMLGSYILAGSEDPQEITEIFQPIKNHIQKTWPTMFYQPSIVTYPSFLGWYKTHYDRTPAGYNMYVGSRLLDEESPSDLNAVTEAYKIFARTTGTAYLVTGKGTREAKPRGGSNAINPVWRKSIIHASK